MTALLASLPHLKCHVITNVRFQFSAITLTSQEILLNQTFRQSAAVFFSGWESSVEGGGYKVNGVTGDDEVGDVTGDDVW